MPAKPKTKPLKLPAIQTKDEFHQAIDEASKLEVEVRRLKAVRDQAIQIVQDQHEPKIEEIASRIKALTALSSTYAAAHRAELFPTGSKSSGSALATYGFRSGNPTLKLLNNRHNWPSVLTKLKDLGGKFLSFVRTVEEVNKDALHDAKLTDSELAEIGVRIDHDERFYILPKSDDSDRLTTALQDQIL